MTKNRLSHSVLCFQKAVTLSLISHCEIESSKELVMIRHEQEQAQKRTTRPRKARNIPGDEKLLLAKRKYVQDQDFDAYQKVLRSISHRYIDALKDAKDSSDEE